MEMVNLSLEALYEPVMASQAALNSRKHLLELERLGDVVFGAEIHAQPHIFPRLPAGDENHRNGCRGRIRLESTQHVMTVQAGHLNVADDEIRPMFPGERETVVSV